MEKFIPTHRLQIGKGPKRTYWLVRAVGPISKGKNDGLNYYNAIVHPRNRSGVHIVPMVPETRLKPLKRVEQTPKEEGA